jgi:hypothetical protein
MTWQPIDCAPKNVPIIVWDDYYLMRIAKWDVLGNQWITDLPYDFERGGKELPLEPVCWQPCPQVPEHIKGAVAA